MAAVISAKGRQSESAEMQSRFIALFAGLAVVAVSLAVVAVSHNSNGPIERLGMQRPILAASPDGMEFEVVPVGMERKGPEFMSMNPQMQMLTCFGHCGADCLAYCEENYLACTKWNPAERGLHYTPHYLEPGPSGGGPDHTNWCRATLDRCKGHCF